MFGLIPLKSVRRKISEETFPLVLHLTQHVFILVPLLLVQLKILTVISGLKATVEGDVLFDLTPLPLVQHKISTVIFRLRAGMQ
jgi:hypothetical protein